MSARKGLKHRGDVTVRMLAALLKLPKANFINKRNVLNVSITFSKLRAPSSGC